jgi:TolB-like protein
VSDNARPGLFSELKRRNVFRVAAAYVVVAWLVLQVGDLAADNLGFPGWFMPMLFVLLGLGFPVAAVLSWAFDLTPEGVQRTASIDDVGPRRPGAGPLDWVIALGILVVIGMFVVDRFAVRQSAPAPQGTAAVATEPEDAGDRQGARDAGSIAVLAFENMSPDPENAYFAEGISEEILNILADIDGLHVASRTSAFSFRGSNTPIPEIAEALDVGHVLEGSVRKQGNRVRITAQLIRADTDGHVWSDTFDRELVDIFEVQEEIAQSITDALGEVLGTRQVSVTASTSDLDAYERFLRGRARFHQRREFAEAIADLELAVAQDPAFGEAWIYLAAANYVAPGYYEAGAFDARQMSFAARRAIERARNLRPEDPMVLAIDAMLRAEEGDQVRALDLVQQAAAMRSQDSTPKLWLGLNLYIAGYVADSVGVFERAVEMDPLVGINNGSLAIAYLATGREQEAVHHAQRAMELGWGAAMWVHAIELAARGERDRALAVLRSLSDGASQFEPSRVALAAAIADPLAAGAQFQAEFERPPEELLAIERADEYLDRLAARAAAGPLANQTGWLRMAWLPTFRAVREDPRFFEAARTIGMVELWEARGYPDGCSRVSDDAGDHLDCSGGDE